MRKGFACAVLATALLITVFGCDLDDPFRGTPFGRRAPAAPGVPQVVETYPEANLTDVSVNEPFRIRFDRAMDRESVSAGLAFQPAVPFTLEQGANAAEWIVRPGEPLVFDRMYTMQLASNIRDTAGNTIGRTVDIRFRTAYQSQTRLGRPAWTPDSGFVFFTASFDGGQSWHLWRTPRWGGWKQRVADRVVPNSDVMISPDGRRVAFARFDTAGRSAELWLAGSDGFNLRRFAGSEDLGGPLGIRGVWSPGSERLVVELGYGPGSAGQDDITAMAVIALDGAVLRRIGAEGRTYRLLGWTSDGRDIVALRSQTTGSSANHIRYEMINWTLATGAIVPIEIEGTVVNFAGAGQSRDYSAVLFWTWRPIRTGQNVIRVPSELWLYRLGGNTISRLAPTAAGNRTGFFAPDGADIIFNSNRTGEWLLWRVGRGGGGLQQVTLGTGADILPAWSPDGRDIAFVSIRGGEEALWMVGPDGRNPRRVAGRD